MWATCQLFRIVWFDSRIHVTRIATVELFRMLETRRICRNLNRGGIIGVIAMLFAWPSQSHGQIVPGLYSPDANTIALYHFDTSGDGITPDATGNHDGTLLGDAFITSGSKGVFGEALSVDGESDYVKILNVHQNPVIDGSEGTFEMWARLANEVFSFASLGNDFGGFFDDPILFGWHGSAGNQVLFGVWAPGWQFATSGVDPADLIGEWHHYAGTWGPDGVKIWIDGELKGTNPYTGGINTNYATGLIGTDSWQVEMAGEIDEVRISSVQLDFAPIPEPSTTLLVLLGGLVLVLFWRRASLPHA